MIFHNSTRNFRFLFEIIALSSSQFISFSRESRANAQFLIFQLNVSGMSVILLKNLQVIDITMSKFFEDFDKIRMKSMMMM